MPRDSGLQHTWENMRSRCDNPNNPQWDDYGGRGICVRFASFDEFLAEVGTRPPGMTIDRIDNDGHYEPGNVRWATRAEQQRNRRNNAILKIDGKEYRLCDLVDCSGIPANTIRGRVQRGLPIDEVLNPRSKRGLSPGSKDGFRALAKKHAAKTHCVRGHAYDAENTYLARGKWRKCRACAKLRLHRRRRVLMQEYGGINAS